MTLKELDGKSHKRANAVGEGGRRDGQLLLGLPSGSQWGASTSKQRPSGRVPYKYAVQSATSINGLYS